MRTIAQMSHVAWSVCLYVYVLGTRVSCAKTAEPRKHVLNGVEIPYGNGQFWGLSGTLKGIVSFAAVYVQSSITA